MSIDLPHNMNSRELFRSNTMVGYIGLRFLLLVGDALVKAVQVLASAVK
jgi:hypothetical protein